MPQEGQAEFSCRTFLFATSLPWLFSSVHANSNHHLLQNLRMTFHVCSSCFCLLSGICSAGDQTWCFVQYLGGQSGLKSSYFSLLSKSQNDEQKVSEGELHLRGEERFTVRLLSYCGHKGARGNKQDPEDRSYLLFVSHTIFKKRVKKLLSVGAS